MIPTALSIEEIAKRLDGVVVSSNMVRAPDPVGDGRTLLVTRTVSGLLVIPPARDDDHRRGQAMKVAAEAHVARCLSNGRGA